MYVLRSYTPPLFSYKQFTPAERDLPFLPLIHPHVLIFCCQCGCQISHLASICSNEGEFCVGCFCLSFREGIEHYFVRSVIRHTSLTQHKWSTLDQLQLLSILERLNYGNWTQISEEMRQTGSLFSGKELMTHYDTYYLKRSNYRPILLEYMTAQEKYEEYEEQEEEQEEQNSQEWQEQAQSLKQQSLCYNPIRDEFASEYDESAELLLENLSLESKEKEEADLILRVIEEYIRRRNQRYNMKAFVQEQRLLDADYNRARMKVQSWSLRAAENTLRPFMRFVDRKQYEAVLAAVADSRMYAEMAFAVRKRKKEGRIPLIVHYDKVVKKCNQKWAVLGKAEQWNIYEVKRVE